MKNKMVVLGLCAVVGSLFSSVVPERQDPAPKDGIRDFVVTTDRADDFSSAEVKVAGDGTAKLYDAAFQEVPLKLDRPRTGRGQLRPGADEEVCFPRTVRDLGVRFESVETFRRWHCHTQSATDSIGRRPAPIGLVSLHFDFPFVRGDKSRRSRLCVRRSRLRENSSWVQQEKTAPFVEPQIGNSTAKASRGSAETRRFDGFSDGIGIYALDVRKDVLHQLGES